MKLGLFAALATMAAYALSALGHSFPLASAIATAAAGLAALYFGYSKVQVGILLVLAELSIGSFGRLLSIDLGGYAVSYIGRISLILPHFAGYYKP
jgi:hypothetical protein